MEKSLDIAPRRGRRFLPWLLFVTGLVIGTVAGRSLLTALDGAVFNNHWHRVMFIKQDLPNARIRTMRVAGQILEHRFVTANFILTNAVSTREGTSILTFVYQLSPESPAVQASIELQIDHSRHCLSEIILTAEGPINRGCVKQIKALF